MRGRIAMLREILDVLQDDPSSQRRWFHDEYFDLFVRQTGGELAAFELCYGIDSHERALVWSQGQGYFHDGGTSASGEFIGARLAPGDPIEADPIIQRFEHAAGGRPQAVRSEEHTSELQSRQYLVCRLLLEKKKHQPEWRLSQSGST